MKDEGKERREGCKKGRLGRMQGRKEGKENCSKGCFGRIKER